MKYFLYVGIAGFVFWIISEILEIVSDYNQTVYYLTSGYHFFAGFGIWAIYKVQADNKSNLGKIGAFITLLSYLGLTLFPLQVMNSGLDFHQFLDANPIYKIPGGFWFLGMMMFGISLISKNYFPLWSALVFIIGTIMFTLTPLLSLPTILVNFTNILLSLTVVYMCISSLIKLKNDNHQKQ